MQLTYRGQSYQATAIAAETPKFITARFRGVRYTIANQQCSSTLCHPARLTFLGVPYLKA